MAAMMNSDLGKLMRNKYLKSNFAFYPRSYFTLPESINNLKFKIMKAAAKIFLRNRTIEELLNSEEAVYLVKTFIQPYVKEFLRNLTKEVDMGNFLFSIQGSHEISQGSTVLSLTRKKHSIGATMRINKYNPTNVELQFGLNTKNILAAEFLCRQFIFRVPMPMMDFCLDEVPVNIKVKAAFDLEDRTIAASVLASSGKLVKGMATIGFALSSYTPKLEASVLINVGFIDAGLIMKKHGLDFGGSWSKTPQLGIHLGMNHTQDRSSTVKGGILLSEPDGGERKISANTHGVVALQALAEESFSKCMVNWNVTYDVVGERGLVLEWKLGN